jgi:FKBP-type peptidyl-prolyl cis-trans isomerase
LHFTNNAFNLTPYNEEFTMNMSMILKAVLGFAVVALVACDKPNMKDEKAQYSYAIGVQIAQNLKGQNIPLDTKAFAAAVKDITEGKEPLMKDDERMAALRKMSEGLQKKQAEAGAENIKKGEEFLEANKAKEGVKVTKSGLQYKVVSEGTGKTPKATDKVEVHYRGRLIDGKEFDSSYSRNQPAQFPVNAVIPGWTEALQLMKTGSKYELYIPSALAYGERGQQGIPPNSVLVFDVELLSIVK